MNDDSVYVPDEDYLAQRRAKNGLHPRSVDWHTGSHNLSERQALLALSQIPGRLLYAGLLSNGWIKIGSSGHLARRVNTLRVSVRNTLGVEMVRLVAVAHGGYEDEATVHSLLAEHRAHGREFYHPHPDVLTVVNGWRHRLGQDDLAA